MSEILLEHHNETLTVMPAGQKTLLEVIQEAGIVGFSAPCGGQGTCGKCRVVIREGVRSPLSPVEKKRLSAMEIDQGVRLACQVTVEEDSRVTVLVPDEADSKIQTFSLKEARSAERRFSLLKGTVAPASLEDQRSMLERITDSVQEQSGLTPSLRSHSPELFRKIGRLAQAPGSFTALLEGERIRDIDTAETIHCGCAIDIGTTTIVIHLLNLIDGTVLSTWSALNKQKQYGADVISRIQYAAQGDYERRKIQEALIRQLDEGITWLLADASISHHQLKIAAAAGNTTMLHLLTGADSSGIAAAPFIPLFRKRLTIEGGAFGFKTASHVPFELLPSISAYVGADISAGIHVTGLARAEDPVLLLDIGTNGEMAIGDSEGVISCSTAAGPAFEGANIRYGTGGITGAVDSAALEDGEINITTINNSKAVGICGSGIIDIAALLVSSGAADCTGKIEDPGNKKFPWIVDFEGMPALLLVDKAGTATGEPIYFTQKDLREVQLAKAAISGGIRTLMKEKGLSSEEITRVYLAGGFGSCIDPASAGIIGLLPGGLAERCEAVGNTAGEGAASALLDAEAAGDLDRIGTMTHYLELSNRADFQNYFIEEMYFGEM